MKNIVKVNLNEVEELSRFASEVVKEHFDPLVGAAQNDYMIAKFQTVESILSQLESGYQYYWVNLDGKRAGFLAFYPKAEDLYLSKFYTHKSFRGNHLAKYMLDFIESEAKKEEKKGIHLNVNRGNSDVIAIYKHLGFKVIREEKNDIGGGFFMDDYVMRKLI